MATTPNLTDKQMTARFLAFCQSKPRDESYPYFDGAGCALGQFARAIGFPEARAGGMTWRIRPDSPREDLPYGLARATEELPWKFGSLADRLAALMAEPTQ